MKKEEATKLIEKDPMLIADELAKKVADQYKNEVETGKKTVEELLVEVKAEAENVLLMNFEDAEEETIYQFFGKFVISLLVELDLIS